MSSTDNDYPYVRAWGRLMDSDRDCIAAQVEQARADGAPPDAIYHHRDGHWAITDNIVRSDTRRQLGLDPLPPRDSDPGEILTELAEAARTSVRLRELYGLGEITRAGENALRLEFATGAVAHVELRLSADGPA